MKIVAVFAHFQGATASIEYSLDANFDALFRLASKSDAPLTHLRQAKSTLTHF